MQAQNTLQRFLHRSARNDLIEKAMLQLKLTALKAVGQLFADGLLDDARPRKADERPRLCKHDVTQAGKAGGHTAGGGVGQYADIQSAAAAEPLQRGAGFGHLHQAEDALLHARAAGDGDAQHGQPLFRGHLKRPRDLFPNDRAHGAHHELRVHDEQGGRLPAAVAVAGGMLGIKPLITIKEGKVAMAGKARGLPGAYVALFKKIEELGGISPDFAAVAGYSSSLREVQPIENYFRENLHMSEPLVRQIGCVIGTHAGPGAFGLAFFDKGLVLE